MKIFTFLNAEVVSKWNIHELTSFIFIRWLAKILMIQLLPDVFSIIYSWFTNWVGCSSYNQGNNILNFYINLYFNIPEYQCTFFMCQSLKPSLSSDVLLVLHQQTFKSQFQHSSDNTNRSMVQLRHQLVLFSNMVLFFPWFLFLKWSLPIFLFCLLHLTNIW